MAPTNCSSTSTSTATGRSICGVAVTNTVSATCPIITTPVITITESCPPGPVTNGSLVDFGGWVCNSGNITLTNIFVFSSQPNNNPVLGPITLAPGACASYAGRYIATGGSNPTTNCIIVTNGVGTITTNVVSVITTNNTPTITTNNVTPTFVSINPPEVPPTGAVSNLFAVGTNLNGLTFYGSATLYGPLMFYSIRHFDMSNSVFTLIIPNCAPHPAPPSPYTIGKDVLPDTNYDALAFAAPQITGGSSVSFYYLRHDTAGNSYFGYIIPGGAKADMFTGGTIGTNFDALTFAAPNPAGVAANLFYYLRHDAAGNSYFGYIDPNAGTAATAATDLFNFSKRINYMTFSAVTGIGYGPTNLFYYLRYDTNGNTVFGTIDVDPAFTGTDDERAVDQFTLTNHFQELEFTPTDVGYGATLFYSITGGYTTTNIVTTYQTNIVTTYQTNTVTTYTTNSVVSFTTTNTVTATGMDICQARIVTAAADCLGPVAPLVLVIGTPTMKSPPMVS